MYGRPNNFFKLLNCKHLAKIFAINCQNFALNGDNILNIQTEAD